MIAGVGIDIIEISRIKAALERASFVKRVFTVQEQLYCDGRGVQRAASYAARFAGKEAVLKAFGTGLVQGSWQDVEIKVSENGRPGVNLTGYFASLAEQRKITHIYISLTHAQEYAAAQVVMWGGNENESCNRPGNAGD
ncbi:holo-[acyl carrier protein] synthase [Lucifera butyrica]|uniref:Holo-[acyl-carrier-protein] synthase n=1 Tax=Lucifera butyrica TaxID=1351585 RepID=A0A498R6M2_9FIRM|nr:holo-ACP synthase [Lucifera butyrica]VBB05813.1 holo-[acyl carrier protein] synthase [Lucifera butyrica]